MNSLYQVDDQEPERSRSGSDDGSEYSSSDNPEEEQDYEGEGRDGQQRPNAFRAFGAEIPGSGSQNSRDRNMSVGGAAGGVRRGGGTGRTSGNRSTGQNTRGGGGGARERRVREELPLALRSKAMALLDKATRLARHATFAFQRRESDVVASGVTYFVR